MKINARWPLMIGLAASLAACNSPAPGNKEAAAVYKKHRVAVWAVDKVSHAVAGFAQAEVGPGETVTLTPAAGYALTVTLGPLTTQEITYDHKNWQKETAVSVKTSHGTGSSEGTANLWEPLLRVEYGLDEKLHSITLLAPVGSLRAKHLVLPEKFSGSLAELEDCILGATEDSYLDVGQVTELYGILGKSERRDRWRALMASKDVDLAQTATAVLAQIGDADGTKAFCELCLATGGNRQLRLIEALSEMPQSDVALETIVKLITATGGAYRLKMPPGVAAADMDRRYGLFQAMLKYPPQKVKPHAAQVVAWAKEHKEDRWAKAVEDRAAGK